MRALDKVEETLDQHLPGAFVDLIQTPDFLPLLEALFVTGQLQRIVEHRAFSLESLKNLLQVLQPIDAFYKEIGGIRGYHEKIQELLSAQKEETRAQFHPPKFIDISKENETVQNALECGILSLDKVAQIVPLGGAADRLHLVDEKTGKELPAALLKIGGKTLLQRLIEDIEAQELCYFKRFGKRITIPLALMTSFEKGNHFHVQSELEKTSWFGRSKDSIRLFTQMLVPAVDQKGNWLFLDDLTPVMKPGGHGVIWKLAEDRGIFSWFESLGKSKLLIRQINNPIAGLDFGLLAFLGIGVKENKQFGFASCPRVLQSAEGVNVVIEKGSKIALTNIEYCDFKRFGIQDLPLVEGEPYSRFSSNTNLLFGDLQAIRQAVSQHPFPGLLLNMKNGSFTNTQGEKIKTVLGRLEATMQNIADVFLEEKTEKKEPQKTFITYNERHKTISTAKKAYKEGGALQETPEACFYDLLFSARDLLENVCGFKLPPRRSLEEYLKEGPEFVFLYSACFGPIYAEIGKKLRGGTFTSGSEFVLEAIDFLAQDLKVDGSLKIFAKQGSVYLKNVTICNQGVDWAKSSPFWKGDFPRQENLEIVVHAGSKLIAENIVLEGSHRFEVPKGKTMRLRQEAKQIIKEVFDGTLEGIYF